MIFSNPTNSPEGLAGILLIGGIGSVMLWVFYGRH